MIKLPIYEEDGETLSFTKCSTGLLVIVVAIGLTAWMTAAFFAAVANRVFDSAGLVAVFSAGEPYFFASMGLSVARVVAKTLRKAPVEAIE